MTKSFTELGVPRELVDVLERGGVTVPFPIQSLTIAQGMAGRDLCGRAPTGSGKTLAFAIPLAARVRASSPGRPRALVLVPTRELAAQVAEELRPLAQARGRTVATFYGGTNLERDRRALRHRVDIAVACPGRLADLVNRRAVSLADVELVVIDEADRMADMGFLPEVKRLLDQTAPTRQTLLFSATLDGDVDVLIRRYQRDPVRHEHGPAQESGGDVRHLFWHAQPSDRVGVTRSVVEAVAPAIVFTRTKHGADRVAKQLSRQGVAAAAMHGDRSQKQRERALADFIAGRVHALVATDVAARGIHVDNVGVVVHFDPPATDKDYVHRSGRTGRAGAAGLVVTLVAPDKLGDVRALQRALAMPQQVGTVDIGALSATTIGAAARAPRPPASRPANGGERAAPATSGPPAAGRHGRPVHKPKRRSPSAGSQGRGAPAGSR